MAIQVENISKKYGDQQVLNSISFDIPKGEIVGFLGPNGAGKSTLMKILTTYIASDSGAASVANQNVQSHKQQAQRLTGYLPEHNPLYVDMYVREYLGFCCQLYKVDKNRIDEVVQVTGLTPESHKKISALSKGYRQRVGLAAALLHDPEVLILDEPTTGLDPNQLVEIRKLIRKLGKSKTILLSTHILQEVEAVCDRVIIINKGNLVADAYLADLRKSQAQILDVEFDYRVEKEFLDRMDHLEKVEGSGFHYTLHFNTDKDMRPAVVDFATEQGLRVLAMNRRNKDLESMFRTLTATAE